MFLIDRVPDHIFESLRQSGVDTDKIMLASYCDMNKEHSFCDTYVIATTESIYVISGTVAILASDSGKKPEQEWHQSSFEDYSISEIEAIELDEMQSSARLADVLFISTPVTVTVSPSRVNFAPSALRQLTVAITSSHSVMPLITLVPFAMAAEIRSLCAMDFDEGARTVPLGVPLCIFTFIAFSFNETKVMITI